METRPYNYLVHVCHEYSIPILKEQVVSFSKKWSTVLYFGSNFDPSLQAKGRRQNTLPPDANFSDWTLVR